MEAYLPRLGYPENRQKLSIAWAYGTAGQVADARKLLDEVTSTSDKSVPPTDFADV